MSFSFPQSDSDPFKNNGDYVFNHFTDQVDSSMKWATAESLIFSLVGIAAIVAIVYAIIDCLKKTGSAIPSYAKVANIDLDKAPNLQPSTDHIAVQMEPELPVIRDSRIKFSTVERMIKDITKEKGVRFSPQEIEKFTSNCSKLLGSGSYGVVFQGELPDGESVAVKVLTNCSNSKKMEEQFIAEVRTIGRTYHANLVRLFGYCFDHSMMALVYEYMENGSLNKFLFDENQELEWGKRLEIAIKTAKAIAYLHEECDPRIIHYDIKPENILLDKSLNPKVADFGLAKLSNGSGPVTMSKGRGTIGYSAPEVWNRRYPVTHKCDVYSFGILLFEIIGRRRHFNANITESRQWLPKWVWDMYMNNELGLMLSLCGIHEKDKLKAERACSVALLCIQDSPDLRPVMSDVVKMLEGGMEILHPVPSPFQYLESGGSNLALNTISEEESNKSESGTNSSEQRYIKSRNNDTEIELATLH